MSIYLVPTAPWTQEMRKYTDLSEARAYAIKKMKESGRSQITIYYLYGRYNKIAGHIRMKTADGSQYLEWVDKRQFHGGERARLNTDGTIKKFDDRTIKGFADWKQTIDAQACQRERARSVMDGWHDVKEYSLYVEDGRVLRATKPDPQSFSGGYLPAQIYVWDARNHVWTNAKGVKYSTARNGIYKGTYGVF